MSPNRRKRVLFFAEDVTLAHIARPLALAQSLDPSRYEVTLASGMRYEQFIRAAHLQHRPITSISGKEFLHKLAAGRPVYDVATLTHYVHEDLEIIEEIQPDVIVGDFRLSLSVSARRAGVPYISIANAYWSPFATPEYQIPSHAIVGVVGKRLANAAFAVIRPWVFAYHSVPMHRLRKRFGLPSLGFDLRRVYTDADYTLYADIPEMVPLSGLDERYSRQHRFLGPVLWSPAVDLPTWWSGLSDDVPLIYVTMGSSGDPQLVLRIISALAAFQCEIVIASPGAKLDTLDAPNVHIADLLPGETAVRRASLVICNGGSPTCHQSLALGVPVLGLAGNLDQYLNMHYVVASGAGKLLRADSATKAEIADTARELMREPSYGTRAKHLAAALAGYHPGNRLTDAIDEILLGNT